MTGGQMAPTTLIGQKTMTTPIGRSLSQDGAPIGMAEIMNAIKSPVYIERCSLGTPGKILKTRKAIRHAIQNQVEKRGFSFVEILSPCPINWKIDPLDARKWLVENLEPIFPVKKFRDIPEDAPPPEPEPKKPWMNDEELQEYFQVPKDIPYKEKKTPIEEQHVKISGFGGQGVMSAGVLLANCATAEGLEATWLPSYGPEMRGGTANASVIVSQSEIGSPVVDFPNVLIAMNGPSMDAFEDKVKEGGTIIVNSSIISDEVSRSDVQAYYIPASDIASQVGLLAGANIVILTLYLLVSRVVEVETLRSIIPLSIKKQQYVEKNLMMVDKAIEYYEKNYKS
jgi:2-oxoisovalerate ferredoxin oxidoreductase beta subunit